MSSGNAKSQARRAQSTPCDSDKCSGSFASTTSLATARIFAFAISAANTSLRPAPIGAGGINNSKLETWTLTTRSVPNAAAKSSQSGGEHDARSDESDMGKVPRKLADQVCNRPTRSSSVISQEVPKCQIGPVGSA